MIQTCYNIPKYIAIYNVNNRKFKLKIVLIDYVVFIFGNTYIYDSHVQSLNNTLMNVILFIFQIPKFTNNNCVYSGMNLSKSKHFFYLEYIILYSIINNILK